MRLILILLAIAVMSGPLLSAGFARDTIFWVTVHHEDELAVRPGTLDGIVASPSVSIVSLFEYVQEKSVKHLDLSQCSLTDLDFKALGKCQSLRVLVLPRASSGALIASVAQLRSASEVHAVQSRATDEEMSVLVEKLESLIGLNVSGSLLVGDATVNKLNRKTIESLSLARCAGVSVNALSGLTTCSSLVYLDLSQSMIDDRLCRELCARIPLECLCVSGCKSLRDAACSSIVGAKTLTRLNVSGCSSIPKQKWGELANLPTLSELDASGTTINDEVLRAIGSYARLVDVRLSLCPEIDGSWLGEKKSLRFLKRLDLSYCSLAPGAIGSLAGSGLVNLDLTGCDRIDDREIAGLGSCEHLKVLALRGTSVKHLSVLAQAQLRKSLASIDCSASPVSDDGFAKICGLSQLQVLRATACANVTAKGFKGLAALSQLRILNVKECIGVDASVCGQIAKCSELAELTFDDCRNITDECIGLVVSLPKLSSLSCRRCDSLTSGMLRFVLKMDAVRNVEINGCTRILDEDVTLFRQARPGVALSGP